MINNQRIQSINRACTTKDLVTWCFTPSQPLRSTEDKQTLDMNDKLTLYKNNKQILNHKMTNVLSEDGGFYVPSNYSYMPGVSYLLSVIQVFDVVFV